MKRTPLVDAAAIAEYEDDISMATAFLTLAENQELECYRLRSVNAELVAALHDLVTLDQREREAKATSYANESPAWKAWEKARSAIERAKQ